MTIDMGIMAYNEEQNIGKLLQRVKDIGIVDNVFVVASGCTDRTVEIAKSMGAKVIVQDTREGKISAINLFLQQAKSEILILCSADVLPSDFCFKYLLEPFKDERVGVVGAHPIPVNKLNSRINKIGNLMWKSHHQMALKYPKAGEIAAFRNKVDALENTLVDEAYIESRLTEIGYRVEYASNAVVFNRSPETVDDFIKQRKRIFIGHLRLMKQGYKIHTINTFEVVMASLKASKNLLLLIQGGLLELKIRRQARKEISSSNSAIWEISNTTKAVI